MRWLVGLLSLFVIGVIFGSPAALLLGWRPLTVTDRQVVSKTVKNAAPSVSTQAPTQ
jgi:hypothetical protein